MNLLQGSMASIEPLKCKKVNASKTLQLPLHACTLFLFRLLHRILYICEKLHNYVKTAHVPGGEEGLVFDISINYR
jgi:hypothetical protein